MLALDEELDRAVDRLVVLALEAGVRGTRAGAVRWGVLEMSLPAAAPALAAALLEAREAMREVVDAYDAGGERPSVVDQERLQHAVSGLRDVLRSGAGQGEGGGG